MRIAYVFRRDAADPAVQSGRPASILAELRRRGVGIEPVFPLRTPMGRVSTARKIACRAMGRIYRGDREPAYLAASGREFARRIADRPHDLVFSPGSEIVGHLPTDRPVVFCADATFANLVDYYPDFSRLSPGYLRAGHAMERAALARAALAVYPSQWAADSAIRDYGADPDRVAVIPFGANIGQDNTGAEVESWIDARPRDHLRLLFVGRDWARKGGDLVVDTAHGLVKLGHQVSLDVVGCKIPARHRDLPWITAHGSLRADNPDEARRLSELFARAHFVFVPSRAEAYGMTFAEAAAFGVPVVGTDTGGIPAVVADGENGRLLPLDARPDDYAEAIMDVFSNEARYRRYCSRARLAFEEKLNWRVFTDRLLERVARLDVAPSPAPAAELVCGV